jgi:hypothetical protein
MRRRSRRREGRNPTELVVSGVIRLLGLSCCFSLFVIPLSLLDPFRRRRTINRATLQVTSNWVGFFDWVYVGMNVRMRGQAVLKCARRKRRCTNEGGRRRTERREEGANPGTYQPRREPAPPSPPRGGGPGSATYHAKPSRSLCITLGLRGWEERCEGTPVGAKSPA